MKARYFYGYNIVAAGFAIQAVGVGAIIAGIHDQLFTMETITQTRKPNP